MRYKDYVPSSAYKAYEEENGEDTFIKLNLLYIAFEMNELYDDSDDTGAFDELCGDVLEISLNEDFERFNLIDIADAVVFIIHDSNYTVAEYEKTYQRRKDRVCEELLAYLENQARDQANEDEETI